MFESESAKQAYTLGLKAIRDKDCQNVVKKDWVEISKSNRLYHGMRLCDSLSDLFYSEFEKDLQLWEPEENESYRRSLHLVRLGLDHAYDEEMYMFPTVQHRCSYYLCRSRLHHRHGRLLLRTKRFYSTNCELQMALDDLLRAINSILDDYRSTENIIPHIPADLLEKQDPRDYHDISYTYKSRKMLDFYDEVASSIERDLDECIEELMRYIPERFKYQLAGYHLINVKQNLEKAIEFKSSEKRIQYLEKLESSIKERFPESSDPYKIKYYAYGYYQPATKMAPYVYWCIQNNLILKYSDPITKSLLPPSCHDELPFEKEGSWLTDLFKDIVYTFSHARFLLYKYSITRLEMGDLRFAEPDKIGFFERLEGSYKPYNTVFVADMRSRLSVEYSVEASVVTELTQHMTRIHEELLIDAFVRLYSILDKISNLIVYEFGIKLWDSKRDKTAKPSIDGIAHYMHDTEEDNPFLRILETLYVEINPDTSMISKDQSKDDEVYYDRLPFAQTLYNLRNHIIHSDLVLTGGRMELDKRTGKIYTKDFKERTKMLALVVKEAIMTTMLAIEFNNKNKETIVRRGHL